MQVLILRLQCQDSIEEKVWQVSEDKRMIADKSIVGGLFDRKTDGATRCLKPTKDTTGLQQLDTKISLDSILKEFAYSESLSWYPFL